jgi:ferritin-like metal-binding protein YciE
MNKLINLKDLLKHEILELYSAEEQIIDSLPDMIAEAKKPELKEVLSNYFEISKTHLEKLDAIKTSLSGDSDAENNSGFFSNLFGGSNTIMSKGVEGLIKEAKKVMNENMTDEVTDAAIIGVVQKIEHYAIAGYGTVRAYALELKLNDIVKTLEISLKEEYAADDLLTRLAIGSVNKEAENATDTFTESAPSYDRLTNSVSIMNSSSDNDY